MEIKSAIGTLALVMSSRAPHFFWAQFHIAKGTSLEGAGEFSPGPYVAGPQHVELFLGT